MSDVAKLIDGQRTNLLLGKLLLEEPDALLLKRADQLSQCCASQMADRRLLLSGSEAFAKSFPSFTSPRLKVILGVNAFLHKLKLTFGKFLGNRKSGYF
ncbi:hypothetical protein [Paenibacillus azoreducens]|uniref:Uncharacterized protein n=1 Tax=Paenibacillus azoreducens TaxID=116718 RepID=A0A920CR04_9BACL|nr:hypothetical protein [Paenibacillus azoreducens]GIO50456.1 hypothetical protein J34TS1_52210 [Paenibacillus azoreducens]